MGRSVCCDLSTTDFLGAACLNAGSAGTRRSGQAVSCSDSSDFAMASTNLNPNSEFENLCVMLMCLQL